jgi:GH15 family glucan-1,4-alpha-glucosidase
MLETDPSFRPARAGEGYPPLEDLGLIGDGATAALVGLDGSIHWMRLPRFDSEPVFCGLLDWDRGGHFTITPDELTEAWQRYEPDTGVLATELRNPTGLVRLDEAAQLYASLCARASPLGLLSEQIDPSTGAFIGNFPQAFSHIGLIASGVTLARAFATTSGQASMPGAPA